MAEWHIGTMGFTYEPWQGVFYPDGTPARQYLSLYSRVFNAVELNTTFYGTPRASTVQQWAAQVPMEFKFSPKTPREITHDLGLSLNRGAGERMAEFVATMRFLGERLGPLLIQLPPSFGPEMLPELEAFLATLPHDLRFAVELRHPAWYAAQAAGAALGSWPSPAACLAHYRVAWVGLDYLNLPLQLNPTTDFIYLRWVGEHERFVLQGYEQVDVSARLRWWQQQIAAQEHTVGAIYGYFNDDYAGYAPATANRFKSLAGLPVIEPEIPRQGTLF